MSLRRYICLDKLVAILNSLILPHVDFLSDVWLCIGAGNSQNLTNAKKKKKQKKKQNIE